MRRAHSMLLGALSKIPHPGPGQVIATSLSQLTIDIDDATVDPDRVYAVISSTEFTDFDAHFSAVIASDRTRALLKALWLKGLIIQPRLYGYIINHRGESGPVPVYWDGPANCIPFMRIDSL